MYNAPVFNYFHRPGSITQGAVSEKTFHFMEHTGEIYRDISQREPSLEPQARYLRVRSLLHVLLTLDTGDRETKDAFSREYHLARKDLGKHWRFLLSSPYFGRQERLTAVLLIAGVYRPLRGLYHRCKKEQGGKS